MSPLPSTYKSSLIDCSFATEEQADEFLRTLKDPEDYGILIIYDNFGSQPIGYVVLPIRIIRQIDGTIPRSDVKVDISKEELRMPLDPSKLLSTPSPELYDVSMTVSNSSGTCGVTVNRTYEMKPSMDDLENFNQAIEILLI